MSIPGTHSRPAAPVSPVAWPGRPAVERVRDTVTAWTEPAARHRRRLLRARASARLSTVVAATSTGATAILVPWHGVGAPDSFWLALTAGTVTATALSWQRVRQLVRTPPPPALPRSASSARPLMDRLSAARAALWTVLRSLGPLAGDTAADAAAAERSLGELAGRVVALEAAFACSPPEATAGLLEARSVLLGSLESGVRGYEDLLAAAAGCVAASAQEFGAASAQEFGAASAQEFGVAQGFSPVGYSAAARLADSADRLRGLTMGLAEVYAPRS